VAVSLFGSKPPNFSALWAALRAEGTWPPAFLAMDRFRSSLAHGQS
jgi:hypothetical protein